MAHTEHTVPGTKLYLRIWLVLLALTSVMIIVDQLALPFVVLSIVLIAAMLTKAGLIGGYFMHLRFDGKFLALSLLFGFVVVGSILFLLILPDALRIADMLREGGP